MKAILITEPPHVELTTLPDPAPGPGEPNRPWRSDFWTGLISKLSTAGYDDVTSIDHEDSLMSVQDGLEKAAAFLGQILIREKLTAIWGAP